MKSLTQIVALLVLLGAVFAPMEAGATIPSKLTITATLYLQFDAYTEDDVYYGQVEKFRVTTKELLSFMQELTGLTFPRGSYFEVDPDGTILVRTRDTVVADVTQYFSADLNLDEDEFFNGTYNFVTGQERSTIYLTLELMITVPAEGTNLHFSGVATERFNAAAQKEGLQRISASIRSNVSGKGTIEGSPALIEGRVGLSGSGTFEF